MSYSAFVSSDQTLSRVPEKNAFGNKGQAVKKNKKNNNTNKEGQAPQRAANPRAKQPAKAEISGAAAAARVKGKFQCFNKAQSLSTALQKMGQDQDRVRSKNDRGPCFRVDHIEAPNKQQVSEDVQKYFEKHFANWSGNKMNINAQPFAGFSGGKGDAWAQSQQAAPYTNNKNQQQQTNSMAPQNKQGGGQKGGKHGNDA